jgi:hypothetical protein
LTGNCHRANCVSCRQSQTCREAGTESHGSLRDSRVAWKGAARLFPLIILIPCIGQGIKMKKIFVFAVILCALVIANISLADGLTDGLMAYYPFDGNANDMSGNGNNASSITGGVSFEGGQLGEAVRFGGYYNPGQICIPNSSTLQFSSSASFDFWLKIDKLGVMDGYGGYVGTAGGGCIFAKDHDRSGIVTKSWFSPGNLSLV